MSPLMRTGFILLSAMALAACSNTWTGVGKDLQEMGKKMDPQAKPVETAPNPANTPSTNPNNKDVTVTPVK
jgi:predicted small secreted protein